MNKQLLFSGGIPGSNCQTIGNGPWDSG